MITTSSVLSVGVSEIVLDGSELIITTTEGDCRRGHWRMNRAVVPTLSPADLGRIEAAVLRIIERRERKRAEKESQHRQRMASRKGRNRY
jgi:hypothetical protein